MMYIPTQVCESTKFRWGLPEETYSKTWVTFCLITSGFPAVSEACKINKKNVSDLYQMWPHGKAVLEKFKFSKEQASFPELIWKCVSSQFLALLQYHIKITLHLFLRATQIKNT